MERRRRTAYHEAGHALVAVCLGLPVEFVSIRAGKDSHGVCRTGTGLAPGSDDEAMWDAGLGLPVELARKHAANFMAGSAAERLVLGNADPAGEAGDQVRLLRFADNAGNIGGLYADVTELLTSHRSALDRLAEALMEREEMPGVDVVALLGIS